MSQVPGESSKPRDPTLGLGKWKGAALTERQAPEFESCPCFLQAVQPGENYFTSLVSTIPSVEWDHFFHGFSGNLSYKQGQRWSGNFSKIAEPDQVSGLQLALGDGSESAQPARVTTELHAGKALETTPRGSRDPAKHIIC